MTRLLDPEIDLLELGLLAPAVVPEVARDPDGKLRIGCRYGCPCPATTDVAMAIRMLVGHIEVGAMNWGDVFVVLGLWAATSLALATVWVAVVMAAERHNRRRYR